MTAKIQQQVAKESGKSFQSVVKDYADQGYGMTETATLLGYKSHSAFIRLCDRHGWRDWFKYGEATNGAKEGRKRRRGIDTPALKAARDKIKYPTVEYKGVHDTMAGHCRRLGVSYRTAKHRQERRPDDMAYILSTRFHSTTPNNTGHMWRTN